MRLELGIRNVQAVAANFRAFDATYQRGVRREVRETGEYCRELTAFYCPVDSGFMQEHVRTDYSDDGLAFETGWSADDFLSAGLEFYPVYVVEGTSRQAPQDPLTPAYAEASPLFEKNLRELLRQSVERASRGAARTPLRQAAARGRR